MTKEPNRQPGLQSVEKPQKWGRTQMGNRLLFRLLLLAGILAVQLGHANSIGPPQPDPIQPFPSLVSAAAANGIPVSGFDAPARTNVLSPGDSVTALITLHEKNRRPTQWLLYLQAGEDDGDVSGERHEPMVLYSSTGNKFEFPWVPAVLRARTIGPFGNSIGKESEVKDKTTAILVNQGYLGLGFEQGAAAAYRWKSLRRADPKQRFTFDLAGKPYDAARVSRERQLAAPLHETPEEERSMAGWEPALMSYFSTVQQTPSLAEIFSKVVAMPSIWSTMKSLLTHASINASIGIDIEGIEPYSLTPAWNLPVATRAYTVPWYVQINNQLSLSIHTVVIDPRPPLLSCAGVVGLIAENPNDQENYLSLRIISAHRGHGQNDSPVLVADPPASQANSNLFDRIVLIGASVTAGFTDSEPLGGPKTEQFALNHYVDAAIRTPHQPAQNFGTAFFFMGDPVVVGRDQIRRALETRPTLVVGIDFLFWFCYGHNAGDGAAALARLNRGLKLLESLPCPVIIGDIPDASAAVGRMLSPDEVPQAKTIAAANERIRQWAPAHKEVTVLHVADFMRAIAANEPLTVHGITDKKTHRLLQSDRLHPTPAGCAWLAVSLLDAEAEHLPASAVNGILWDPREVCRLGLPHAPNPADN